MSLKDYEVSRDKFELDSDSTDRDLAFPCNMCAYRVNKDSEEPCRTCDHNANAVPDDQPNPTGQAVPHESARKD